MIPNIKLGIIFIKVRSGIDLANIYANGPYKLAFLSSINIFLSLINIPVLAVAFMPINMHIKPSAPKRFCMSLCSFVNVPYTAPKITPIYVYMCVFVYACVCDTVCVMVVCVSMPFMFINHVTQKYFAQNKTHSNKTLPYIFFFCKIL